MTTTSNGSGIGRRIYVLAAGESERPNNALSCDASTCEHGAVPNPRTDRDRLVGHAYKNSAAFLARVGLYRYQRDGVDFRAWVIDQVEWPADACVLDVGCGPGRYLAKFPEMVPGGQAIGIDLSAGMAAEARAVAEVVVGDAQALPFPDTSVDGVIAAHMLYHVPEVDTALHEFARVVHPEGCVLIVLNRRDHLREIRQLMRGALRDVVGTDYVLPARSTERFTVEAAAPVLADRFEIVRCERMKRTVELPVAQPVVEYVDSMRSFYEPLLRDDIDWKAIIDRVRERVEAEIDGGGVWQTHADAGCFVCRPR
jgi:ubiquinone/menaquinone biosynthesis C-methylase UbiE